MTDLLSDQPHAIKQWLEAMPRMGVKGIQKGDKSLNWRVSRLNYSRRRKLSQLLNASKMGKSFKKILATWLLKSIPVGSYIEIASIACAKSTTKTKRLEECTTRIIDYRNSLLDANLGLAFSVAKHESGGTYDERCSDARKGLLDAVDRYVPTVKAVRFGYFANYWIKFQITRGRQKLQSVVTFPINQQRIKSKTERIQAEREANGLPPLSVEDLAKELRVGVDTVINSQQVPIAVSINTNYSNDEAAHSFDYALSDPAPEPDSSLADNEVIETLRHYYRTMIKPETRVMLDCMRDIGSLPEAILDYLNTLCESAQA